jgi:eukaryotic-like serine/threonine-protein kinase
VLHRDVKPRNVVLCRDGRVVLTDFGLSAPLEDGAARAEGTAVGTPFYMSPEQVRGDVPVGPATDVYGLGVTLYTLLAARPPFPEKDSAALARAIRTAEPPALGRSVPGDLARVVDLAMRKEPKDRYGSARALADDLDRFVRGEPVSCRAKTPLEVARDFVERHRTGVAVASAALGLAALAVLLREGDASPGRRARTPARPRRRAARRRRRGRR